MKMRALQLLLVAVVLTTIQATERLVIPSDPVYDVTTLYRLLGEVPSSERSGELVDVPSCFVDGNKCGWERGKRWNNSDSNFASAPFLLEGEFDNTVFEQPGSVEVHARTNARGLPFVLSDGTIKHPDNGVQIPECSLDCKWNLYNLTQLRVMDSLKPLLNIDKTVNFVDWTRKPNARTAIREFNSPLVVKYEVTTVQNYRSVSIFLMDNRQDIQHGDMYYMQLIYSSYGTTSLYKCTQVDRNSNINMPGGVRRTCTQKVNYNFAWNFPDNQIFSFKLERIDGRILLTTGPSTVIFNWTDPNPIKTTHVMFGSDTVIGKVIGASGSLLLSLTDQTGSLVSPPLPQITEHVCVSLVFYAEKEAFIDLVLQQDKTEAHLGTFHTGQTQQVGTWKHKYLVANVPSAPRTETRVVVRVRKETGTNLFIQRVAGCNAEGLEDVLMLPKQPRQAPVDVPHFSNYSKSERQGCHHGGLRHHSGTCVCPPGFTGKTCSEGCGANSYGADCGGKCSESDRGCLGTVLCKPMLGCDCAPGFKGPLCNTRCEYGEYGAGCRQSCGRCVGGLCDVYTGICYEGCEPGHYPPFCHHLYSHVSKSPLVVINSFDDANVKANLWDLAGHGKPIFYQVQYKEGDDDDTKWRRETPQLLPESVTSSSDGLERKLVDVGHLKGLKPGTDYILRVVLIDQTLSSYQGGHVPSTAFSTPCTVPTAADFQYYDKNTDVYQLAIVLINKDGFKTEWNFTRGNITWCPVIGYELHVKLDWRWITYRVDSDVTSKVVTGLSPGKQYTAKMRAVTTQGPAEFSQLLTVMTVEQAPDYVTDLAVTQASENSLKLSWGLPRNPAGTVRSYLVEYECLHLGACPEESCSDGAASTGKLKVTSTSAQLDGLLPFALYKISVAGHSGSLGLAFITQAATTLSSPYVAPSSATPDIISRTNSSFVVQWAPPDGCRLLNGYLTGYRYELFAPGQKTPLLVGTTTNHNASFSDLEPHSDFVVRVFATTSAGWNAKHALEIDVKTRATTPEIVQNLAVYKRGRRMLGLRWTEPRMTYGPLKSFTVTHRSVDGTHTPGGVTVKPTPCAAWPHLFCHTIKTLKPDKDYIVAVQARNSEVPEDGDEVSIKTTTREGAPSAPSFLRVKNVTEVTLSIEWGLPDLINGQLRSFLLSVEETDAHNASGCCQYFPIQEVVVTVERLSYEFEVTGLKAASTYEVSVTAKTVSLSPAVTLTAHTRPPTPVLTHAPRIEGVASMRLPLKVHVEPAAGNQTDLVSGYLLLLKDDSGDGPSPLSDEWLAAELKRALNGSLSLAAEFTQADLPEDGVIELLRDQPMVDGAFGSVGLRALVPGFQYRPVWAVVSEYCSTLSMGYIIGEPFTVEE